LKYVGLRISTAFDKSSLEDLFAKKEKKSTRAKIYISNF